MGSEGPCGRRCAWQPRHGNAARHAAGRELGLDRRNAQHARRLRRRHAADFAAWSSPGEFRQKIGNREMKRVAVLGGGPAGAFTAERLARGGLQTTVLDEKLAWEKPCGGGLTYKAY